MKNKVFIPVIMIVALLGLFSGCYLDFPLRGNGKIVTQTRSAKDFDSVRLDGVADNVFIHHSGTYKVTVTTDSNIQDHVKIKVDGGTLRIGEKTAYHGFDPTKLIIDVYMPLLTSVNLKGVGNFKVADGQTSDLELILSGVGDIDVRNYEAEDVRVALSGVGDIKIWVTNSLTGKLSGVGDILYKGDPVINNVSKSGIGEVRKL